MNAAAVRFLMNMVNERAPMPSFHVKARMDDEGEYRGTS